MELFRAKARLNEQQARYEPWKAFAAGGATVIVSMVVALGILRLSGLI